MAFAEFQIAVRAALNSNPVLVALIGADKVLDDVPHGSEPSAPAYPYVTIGDQVGVEDGSDTHQAADMSISVHAWSRYAGRLECLRMLDAIRDAVHDKSLFVSDGTIVLLLYASHETFRDGDGETRHGVIRFGGLYQYG